MRDLIRKEFVLSASPLAYFFVLFGFMFMLPGYPVLCGAFFSTLGLYQSFICAELANDTVFSALLPVAKKDVVRARFIFCSVLELAAFAVMAACAALRGTALRDAGTYRDNFLMNANPAALGFALVIFGVFNVIFAGGFYRRPGRITGTFVIYSVTAFVIIAAAEILHHIPGLEAVDAPLSGAPVLQTGMLAGGVICYAVMTLLSLRSACSAFEDSDL